MKRRLLLAAAIGALVLPAAAQAKGPDQARISGPGLDGDGDRVRPDPQGQGLVGRAHVDCARVAMSASTSSA